MHDQPILAFDCACVGGSVALRVGGHTHAARIEQSTEAAQLIPTMDALMRSHGVAYADLGAMISTVGPGSFTGVRIGLAALHGLALAHPTPIKTLSTLEAMAWAIARRADAPTRFYTALRAGKGELYTQCFEVLGGAPVAAGEITLMPETTLVWDAPCFGNHLAPEDVAYLRPDAAILCEIAAYLPIRPLAEALPLYIRPPDAIAPAPHAWLRGGL